MVQLPPELVARLDERAEAAGVSRSRLIRDAIAAYLRAGADREAAVADRYADAYARFPLDTPDAWGDLESWHAGLERARAAGSAGGPAW